MAFVRDCRRRHEEPLSRAIIYGQGVTRIIPASATISRRAVAMAVAFMASSWDSGKKEKGANVVGLRSMRLRKMRTPKNFLKFLPKNAKKSHRQKT